MVKFATKDARAAKKSPIRTISTVPDTFTHEGGRGYSRTPQSELFVLAVSNMVSEDTFYESAQSRDDRFVKLIWQNTKENPEWVGRFVRYLRSEMFMRSASIVMAAEFAAAARRFKNVTSPTIRSVVDSALQRADEPAEMLAYWHATYGRSIPAGVKRGVADAVRRLFNENSALKYDGQGRAWRMGDVIDLVRPHPVADWQSELFAYLLATRHNREEFNIANLPKISANREVAGLPEDERRKLVTTEAGAKRLNDAGFTWERLSGWLNGPMDAKAWESIIPSMGYMALLRNLRNFDDAGVSDEVKGTVAAKLASEEEVAKSRQFPIRFYSAYKNVRGLDWATTLEKALKYSVKNVPEYPGRTLVLIDVSGSMSASLSDRSTVKNYEISALFGSAVGARSDNADIVAFGTRNEKVDIRKGDSVLRSVSKVDAIQKSGHLDYGTNIWGAYRDHYDNHDRVLIFTDEQGHDDYKYDAKPYVYVFNLGGYRTATAPSGHGKVMSVAGLSDAAFRMLSLLERGTGNWPF